MKMSSTLKKGRNKSFYDERSTVSEDSSSTSSQDDSVPSRNSSSYTKPKSSKPEDSPKGTERNRKMKKVSDSKMSSTYGNRPSHRSDAINRSYHHSKLDLNELIQNLENVVIGVQELNGIEVLKELEGWKEKALKLQDENNSMSEKISILEQDLRSAHSRIERLGKKVIGKEPLSILDRLSSLGEPSLSKNSISISLDDDEVLETSNEVKTLLGTSFRSKWDRRKVAGLKPLNQPDEVSIGEDTVAARKYIEEYMEDHKMHKVAEAIGGSSLGSSNGDMTNKKWMEVLSI